MFRLEIQNSRFDHDDFWERILVNSLTVLLKIFIRRCLGITSTNTFGSAKYRNYVMRTLYFPQQYVSISRTLSHISSKPVAQQNLWLIPRFDKYWEKRYPIPQYTWAWPFRQYYWHRLLFCSYTYHKSFTLSHEFSLHYSTFGSIIYLENRKLLYTTLRRSTGVTRLVGGWRVFKILRAFVKSFHTLSTL